MIDYEILKVIWWLFIGVLLTGFAVMDGHDMGVGSLLPFLGKNDNERRVMINSVAPHWDGNQVWLITGGGAMFAAWPMMYAVAFSGCAHVPPARLRLPQQGGGHPLAHYLGLPPLYRIGRSSGDLRRCVRQSPSGRAL